MVRRLCCLMFKALFNMKLRLCSVSGIKFYIVIHALKSNNRIVFFSLKLMLHDYYIYKTFKEIFACSVIEHRK